jgi:regulator of cell morphogenesis and NO signaling
MEADMSELWDQTTVGDIVAADFRTAAVFESFGIDFCCGGRHEFADACRQAAADPAAVRHALDALPPADVARDDFASAPLEQLIDHIVDTHHAYVRSALPTIGRYLEKLVEAHGARHPELVRILTVFRDLRADFERHLIKEEQVLFPYVRDLATTTRPCGVSMSPFGTVENPIRMLEREHLEAGDEMRAIRALTHGYEIPADGCGTYEVCMAELWRFERDLHRHVHLENNVLFPRAIQLEASSR